jgi:hypothetical protein
LAIGENRQNDVEYCSMISCVGKNTSPENYFKTAIQSFPLISVHEFYMKSGLIVIRASGAKNYLPALEETKCGKTNQFRRLTYCRGARKNDEKEQTILQLHFDAEALN